ncbi:MAG: aminoglycoside phosphotransferase family protein [Bacillati bacterium ANGP1]|uniref:Aminoglycoside phosphotransferase family protein n=1 Tax=Candidatus Segetimicrobium genomatis TaxID=2569760 RepID=A0A537K285_9BACT|nr:MAG: aminoglycoside phosphotransferase family protein [Terrabacteria group bacterium ANGP1]
MSERAGVAPRGPRATSGGETPDSGGMTREMRRTLEEGLSRLRGRPVRIRELRRRALRTSRSFRTERVRVILDGGESVRVFFKDLNPRHQTEKAQRVRAFDFAPGRREVQMYQSVLSPARFGTPHLYASRWEPEQDIYWLFLEDAGSTLVRNSHDMTAWVAAARWIARFHTATRRLPDSQTGFLPQFDRRHYRRCADTVRRILPDLDARERRAVSRGLDCYAGRIDWLSALPRNVIHGQFFGQNIVLRRGGRNHAIAVVDWESAAMGPGLFDLASLTAGRWTREQRQSLLAAYVAQYQDETGDQVDWKSFCRDLCAVALYQSLEWIGWWGRHRRLSRDFSNFLKELERALAQHSMLC